MFRRTFIAATLTAALAAPAFADGHAMDIVDTAAAAGNFGCIISVALLAPDMRVQLLFPPVTLTMRQFGLGVIAFSLAFILFDLNNAGGHAGHLGGIIAGFLLMRFVPWFKRGTKARNRRPRRQRYESKLSPRSETNLSADNEVDAILDKVSAEGFQSLTDKEKDVLRKAAGEKKS